MKRKLDRSFYLVLFVLFLFFIVGCPARKNMNDQPEEEELEYLEEEEDYNQEEEDGYDADEEGLLYEEEEPDSTR